jgi:hypothetical protein
MNAKTSALAGVLFLAGSGFALAQTVIIQPEQETVIREYVVREKAPEALIDFDITVGSIVPDEVEVRTLTVPDIDTRYDYVVRSGRTVLVEPGSRRIVHIIE